MDLELIIAEGEDAGRSFALGEGERKIVGRAPECEIRLQHQGVSRRHCELENTGTVVVVCDLDSVNGTLVNGEPIAHAHLAPGDELALGPTVLHCRQRLQPLASSWSLDREDLREDTNPSVVRKRVDTRNPASDVADMELLRRAQSNLATAYRVSQLLMRATDNTALFQDVIDAIFENSAADRAALVLRDNDAGGSPRLRIVAARSRRPEPGSAHFVISSTIVRDVIESGVSLLKWDAVADERYRTGDSVLQQRIRSVVCVPVASEKGTLGVLYADSLSRPGAFSESDLELLALIGNQAGVVIDRADLERELERSFYDTIRAVVATIDAKDGYTHHHSERVATFAVRIGRELGRPDKELQTIRLAALVHDVGKVGVPEHILNKPEQLSEQEFEQMRLHPIHGVDILSHIQSPRLQEILPGVRHHHERWDGSGYPDGLAGEQIPFLGRLLAVADALDAVRSGRPYREKRSLEQTIELLTGASGTHFDPAIIDAVESLHERGELDPSGDQTAADQGETAESPSSWAEARLL